MRSQIRNTGDNERRDKRGVITSWWQIKKYNPKADKKKVNKKCDKYMYVYLILKKKSWEKDIATKKEDKLAK